MNSVPDFDKLPALSQSALDDILTKHADFMTGVLGGARAVLQYLDLSGLDLSGCNCEQVDFTGSNLSHTNLSKGVFNGAIFYACDLRHANLEGGQFQKADFRGAAVIGANLLGADLDRADLREGKVMTMGKHGEMVNHRTAAGEDGQTSFVGAKMSDTNMNGLRAHNADFSGADLTGAIIQNADLTDVDFKGANLSDVDFTGSDMSQSDLSECIMTGTVLEQIGDRDINLSGIVMDDNTGKRLESVGKTMEELLRAHKKWIRSFGKDGEQLDLSGFDLRDVLNLKRYPLTAIKATHATFIHQDLSGADLQSVYCDHSDFRDCKLQDADMRGSSFRNSNFARSNLNDAVLCPLEFERHDKNKHLKRTDISGSNFSHASLSGADMRHCIMMGVDLTHAVLSGCDLRGADLSGAILTDTVLDDVLLDGAIIDEDAIIKAK